jgi:hypothetical protein
VIFVIWAAPSPIANVESQRVLWLLDTFSKGTRTTQDNVVKRLTPTDAYFLRPGPRKKRLFGAVLGSAEGWYEPFATHESWLGSEERQLRISTGSSRAVPLRKPRCTLVTRVQSSVDAFHSVSLQANSTRDHSFVFRVRTHRQMQQKTFDY